MLEILAGNIFRCVNMFWRTELVQRILLYLFVTELSSNKFRSTRKFNGAPLQIYFLEGAVIVTP